SISVQEGFITTVVATLPGL
nr:immunoglobulin heavy chain junction region [Mus musculus]